MVQHADIDHTGLPGVGGGVGGIVDSDRIVYTSGDITHNSTTLIAVSGPGDLSVAATAGDVCLIGLIARPTTTTAASLAFDYATIVSAAAVNYVFAASGTPINIPTSWYIGSGETNAANGSQMYVVQAGDISGGNVAFRLYCRSSASRVIEADATAPLVMWVINLGQ